MTYIKHCRCLSEIENGLSPTRKCFHACTNQIEILEDRKKLKILEDTKTKALIIKEDKNIEEDNNDTE